MTHLDSIDWIHDSVFLLTEVNAEKSAGGLAFSDVTTYGNAGKCPCSHVLHEGEVGRKRFIAAAIENGKLAGKREKTGRTHGEEDWVRCWQQCLERRTHSHRLPR